MKKPIVKCPRCGSENTREWGTGVGIYTPNYLQGIHIFDDDFYNMMRDKFGESADISDYYCGQNICDDCDCRFATKNIIKVEVVSTIVFEGCKSEY